MAKRAKYIFVLGGVMSGIGKGVAAASIGRILKARDFQVNLIKVDSYLNVDAGTMNPTEHGEVFVLRSGLECDQDMGNYERFLNRDSLSEDYITSGMVYRQVIERERQLGYQGSCVEAVPHIVEEILRRIRKSNRLHQADVSVLEIGGTVGDYQNIMFIEAARFLKLRHPEDVLFVMVTYLPLPNKIGEMKTKPTQNAIRLLNSYGIQPDIVLARSEQPLDQKRKKKIAVSCNIRLDSVLPAPDVESIYDVPLNFEKSGLARLICRRIGLPNKKPNLKNWEKFVESTHQDNKSVKIGVVGKYFNTGDFILSDVYVSVLEAIKFSCYDLKLQPVIDWISSRDIESGKIKLDALDGYDGIIVPGGFGETGVRGKLSAIRYAREKKIPYLGLCYGMQLAIVEYAQNVLGLEANTTEIDKKTAHPVIDIIVGQRQNIENLNYGATMRLGAYPALIKKGTIAAQAYGRESIEERHRHRYEVNPEYISKLEAGGLIFSGISPDKRLMEIMELPKKDHPFFVGTQFHPEFQARPLNPHPLFTSFVKACRGK
jgi:CTP synthase